MAQAGHTLATALRRVALLAFALLAAAQGALAAPYAAMVMDARDGRVIFARNHETRLHPASLTKMMTLYIAFDAIQRGELSLDTPIRISATAAGTQCSCLGLRAGQSIALRYLIRAAALRSANDASVAIAEAISGSEAAFAERMTRTARAMGMADTTFRNSHGLTQSGHMSSARDMTVLGRQLYFDFPQFYNIFARRSDHAGIATVPNTNRALLNAVEGADGIKTGFTRAAGFNLVASAQRGDVRIIATMFGGTSPAARNAHVAELLEMGFARAERRVAVRPPNRPAHQGGERAVAQAPAPSAPDGVQTAAASDRPGGARTSRLDTAVTRSPRPPARPAAGGIAPPDELLLALQQSVGNAIAAVTAETVSSAPPVAAAAPPPVAPDRDRAATVAALEPPAPARPPARPQQPVDAVAADLAQAAAAGFQVLPPEDFAAVLAQTEVPAPQPAAQPAAPRANQLIHLTAADDAPLMDRSQVAMVTEAFAGDPAIPEIVSRLSTSGGRIWGITLGNFPSRHAAERALIQTGLAEAVALENGLRRIRQAGGGFEASFAGLTRDEAEMACLRMAARQRTCFTVSP